MSIGMFVDGSFVYKAYPEQIDYLKLRQLIETELADTIDEAYFFSTPTTIHRKRPSSIIYLRFRRPTALDFD